ncbi:MAG TPA: hypothetical protein VH684_10170 [Xanthobacteraceae bacterium]|jgi:adenine-specific DNA-methyltransferase
MPDLMGMKNVMVINDEAHHCYREEPKEADDEELKGEDKKEAEKNNEAAGFWIAGLEAVNRKLGVSRVIDLSATPFFLRGSGYAEGTLFPWTMSDFSLMDAIKCGIVKLPRVPVAQNIPGDEMPMFRNLSENIRKDMPKKGRRKGGELDPLDLPARLQTALEALYGHYEKTFALWQEKGIKVPPCFIIVCQNTAISKLVYDFISGFVRKNEVWRSSATSMRIRATHFLVPTRCSSTANNSKPATRSTRISVAWPRTRSSASAVRSWNAPAMSAPAKTSPIRNCSAAASTKPVHGNIRHGFVYERVPHITLKSIANNSEIEVIWEEWQTKMGPLRENLNAALGKQWQEWEIPRVAEDPWDKNTQQVFYSLQAEQALEEKAKLAKIEERLQVINFNLKRNYTLDTLPKRPADPWPEIPAKLHAEWCEARIARQKEIDASIAAKADFEYLYDKPHEDKRKVRVAGPFTVESLSPHRILGVDENDELIDGVDDRGDPYGAKKTFPEMILENLYIAGVQQAHKEDRITFSVFTPWPGDLVCAEGRYMEGETEKRAAIFIGPEFGTVQRADLVAAAREAGDSGFDVLIACAFSYEAHTTEFTKLGRIPVLKARMNADLHMAEDLKATGKGNLFVIFGEPDIDLIHEKDGRLCVKVKGVDVFKPQTGEVISDNADGIACWFIDTDYNEESFFVRHAYFLGANDPYGALKTTLKAEIDPEAWATLHSDTSRPFDKPSSGHIAVKVINHLGDEVMKVFRV